MTKNRSVIRLTDDTAATTATTATYAYDSWGNTTTATGAQAGNNPWQYAGGYKDTTTGLTKFGARYYDPTLGRFTQPDPSGQEQNRYSYAMANPIGFVDPSGLLSFGDVLAGVGLAVGIAALFTLTAPGMGMGLSLLAVAGFWTSVASAGYQWGCSAQGGGCR